MYAKTACYLRRLVPHFLLCINLVSLLLGELRVGSHECSFDLVVEKRSRSSAYRSAALFSTCKVALGS